MRFGKRLALAMIRDSGEVPYISQKPLKHLLVGLEKLCKSYLEQEVNMLSNHLPQEDLIENAKVERSKYGLSESDGVLRIDEVVDHDAKFFQLMDTDVVAVRRYVELCEASLMESLNEWLDEASRAGIIEGEGVGSINSATNTQEISSNLNELKEEYLRIKQYIDVNTTALRKLIARRNKNVPPRFWSRESYENLESMKSNETDDMERLVNSLVSEI